MTAVITNNESQLIKALKTVGDETRYKIFKLLLARQELCVGSIAEELGISASAVSQHFRLFELAGLVNKNRYGQKICYVLKPDNRIVKQLIAISRVPED